MATIGDARSRPMNGTGPAGDRGVTVGVTPRAFAGGWLARDASADAHQAARLPAGDSKVRIDPLADDDVTSTQCCAGGEG